MAERKDTVDKSSWAIGGGVILGLGVGMFLLPSGLAFVGSVLGGLGLGLIITAVLSRF